MKKVFLATALAALGAMSQAQAAFTPITIDPDGAGAAGSIQVTSLNWLAGNSLTVGALGQVGQSVTDLGSSRTLTTYYQAALNTFVNNTGGSSSATLPAAGTEWTVVATIIEQAQFIGTPSAAFLPVAGTVSIYYGAKDSNDITGTGYSNGTEILRGTVVGGSGNFLDFTRLTGGAIPVTGLDAFGDNNTPGVGTHQGSGQSTIKIDIGAGLTDFVDSNFFLSNISSFDFLLTSFEDVNDSGQLVSPFSQSNPSALVNGVAPSYSPGNATYTAGINGGDCAVDPQTGLFTQNCDFQFQTTNVTSFRAVPEPGALALAGLGLGVLGMFGRKRKTA